MSEIIKKQHRVITILLSLSLLLVQCHSKACRDIIDCHNGGNMYKAASGECACNCPQGYSGLYCDARADFMTCKVTGVPYKAITMYTNTTKGSSGVYRHIFAYTKVDSSEAIILNFFDTLTTGTYNNINFTFWGGYMKDKSNLYESGKGSITLTNVTERLEGTFNFVARPLGNPQDTVIITEGFFSKNW